jgi:hypothetical protein
MTYISSKVVQGLYNIIQLVVTLASNNRFYQIQLQTLFYFERSNFPAIRGVSLFKVITWNGFM